MFHILFPVLCTIPSHLPIYSYPISQADSAVLSTVVGEKPDGKADPDFSGFSYTAPGADVPGKWGGWVRVGEGVLLAIHQWYLCVYSTHPIAG